MAYTILKEMSLPIFQNSTISKWYFSGDKRDLQIGLQALVWVQVRLFISWLQVLDCHLAHQYPSKNILLYRSATGRREGSGMESGLKIGSHTRTQSHTLYSLIWRSLRAGKIQSFKIYKLTDLDSQVWQMVSRSKAFQLVFTTCNCWTCINNDVS